MRIDDALARFARLESAPRANLTAPNWSIGATPRRDNIISERVLKNVANFGAKNGLARQDWVMENTLEDVTDVEFQRWANDSLQNQVDVLKQLYCLKNAKLVDGAMGVVWVEASKGNIRGARAWKRVQVHAVGLTQDRLAEFHSELNNLKRAECFDDLPCRSWELMVHDSEFFPQSGVTDEVKMDLFMKIIPKSLQQFTSALISAGGYNYEKLRYIVDSQVAQHRTAKSYGLGDHSGMIIGEVSTEQTTENAQNPNSGSNSGADCYPWKRLGRRWNI